MLDNEIITFNDIKTTPTILYQIAQKIHKYRYSPKEYCHYHQSFPLLDDFVDNSFGYTLCAI